MRNANEGVSLSEYDEMYILSAPFVFYTLIGSVLNAVIHFTFSLPLATIFLVYAYSGFEESIYLFRAYKYDSSKS